MRWVGPIAAVLLLAGGCSRHAPAPPAPKSAPAAAGEEAPPAEPAEEAPAQTEREAPPAAPKATAPPQAKPAAPGGIAIGMSREDLLDQLGACAHLVTMVPGGVDSRSVEVYEPEPGRADCVKQFGERQFMVVAGKLDSLINGLNRAPVPRAPPPGAGHNM